MATSKSKFINWAGLTPIVENIRVGATKNGELGTLLTGTEITYLDGLTAGTAVASKALVLGSSKEISTITTATITNLTSTTVTPTTVAGAVNFTGTPTLAAGITNTTGTVTLGAGSQINLDSESVALTGTGGTSTGTMTKMAARVTSGAITTAGGAAHVATITYTGAAATDYVFISYSGGANTTKALAFQAVPSTNTITVTITNLTAATSVDGTVIFDLLVLKA